MSNKENLKHYLIDKDKPFLLDPKHNGKSIMISGAWGSGKTHFWQKEIETVLVKNLNEKDKACVYVSLYGKDSLSDIKSDVYLSASGKSSLSKEVATFGMEALSAIKDSELLIGKVVKAGKGLVDSKKIQKGINRLKHGGIICFDDFERKSKNVNLNDLFGFISQLAINLECKVVIILNSDVFLGEEADIFSRVKEKTISKFFHHKPSIEELFESIASDEKYNLLNDYQESILSAVKETAELNARIYIQVLDNCLEWLDVRGELNSNIIRVLVLTTFNFVLHHMILDYQTIQKVNSHYLNLIYKNIVNTYPPVVRNFLIETTMEVGGYTEDKASYLKNSKTQSNSVLINGVINRISKLDVDTKQALYSEPTQIAIRKWIDNHHQELRALWKYGYRLYYVSDVNKETYDEIAQFIQSGILV